MFCAIVFSNFNLNFLVSDLSSFLTVLNLVKS